MKNLGNIELEGENIDLSFSSIKKLKETLNQINDAQTALKQEIDDILSELS